MVKINFSTFNGLAGDQHLLLIAETDCGIKESMLFDRIFPFNLSFCFARKKLIKKINKMEEKILNSLLKERLEIREDLLNIRIRLLNIGTRLGIKHKNPIQINCEAGLTLTTPFLENDEKNNKFLKRFVKESSEHTFVIEQVDYATQKN